MGRKSIFMNNYFKLCSFIEDNDKLTNKLKKESDLYIRNLILANVPKRYWKFKWDHIKSDLLKYEQKNQAGVQSIEHYMTSLETQLELGHGLYIFGGHGTSKTTTALLVLQEAIKKQFSSYYIHFLDIKSFISDGWKNPSKKVFWEYIVEEIEFLVLDDIAREDDLTEREKKYLDEIFIHRSNNCLSTIVTTNLNYEEDFYKIFGEAIYSLCKETLKVVEFIRDDVREIT